MKKSPEAAAEAGELLGEPYTPPGRTAVFDVPAYDDVADLQVLFKRFANTCAAYSEAGGGSWIDKTAAFTVASADLFKTFLCTWATVQQVTMPDPATFNEGDRITVIQGGVGKVQIAGTGVVGSAATGGQYQGLTVTVHDGKWWCVPFGSSGGGSGGGPVTITKTAVDYTVAAKDMGSLIAVDTVNGNRKVTVPADDGSIPIGSVFVVANVGTPPSATVTIIGAAGVVLQDRANVNIVRYKSLALVKRDTNTWLINAGGGEGGGAAPAAPTNVAAFGGPGSLIVSWTAPTDDGGHTITGYLVEYGTDQSKLDKKYIADANDSSATIPDLTVGTTYYAWVKAMNSVGNSDPSSIVSAKPVQDYNAATGGEESTYVKDGRMYRVHKFTGANTLTVTKAAGPFRVLVLGQGGGGGSTANNNGGGGGGGGACIDTLLTLTAKAYSVKVGAPSSFDTLTANAGENGHSGWNEGAESGKGGNAGNGNAGSYAQGVVPAGGGGGGAGAATGGQGGGQGIFSDIDGVTKEYGRGGDGGAQHYPGNAAGPAVVIVSYEIAPFNDATGGDEVKEIPNYNGTGETWRYHKFTSSGELVVKTAAQPFHVLVVAGGGGGAGGGPYYGGGGGGGAGGYLDKPNTTLLSQKYSVVIGNGGVGGEGARSGAHNGVAGRQGGTSSIAGIEATGGGGGDAYQDPGSNGGSGSGSYNTRSNQTSGIPGQGNPGGPGEPGPNAGAGGGGGGAASAGVANGGGAGKASTITGAAVTYASGGGCADTAGPAAPNTGNGGNGIRYGSPNYGGTGGSGVVIVAYRIK